MWGVCGALLGQKHFISCLFLFVFTVGTWGGTLVDAIFHRQIAFVNLFLEQRGYVCDRLTLAFGYFCGNLELSGMQSVLWKSVWHRMESLSNKSAQQLEGIKQFKISIFSVSSVMVVWVFVIHKLFKIFQAKAPL